MPDSYFSRLRGAGIDISRHLLLREPSEDPSKLKFDRSQFALEPVRKSGIHPALPVVA